MNRSVSTTALWQLSARELASRIARGEVSSVEAVDAHIERIEAVNPSINAVCWKRYDAARAEARKADAARAAGGKLGPLHGVPITVKECLDLAGSPSTFGLPSRAKVLAERDERHVARLRQAGAVVLGKTNVAQLLIFIEADNPLYGRTNNPWDLDRAPGGSSGGQAAIVAAGGSPLGIGTDIGGSNRAPAAFCGIVGFKPTAGRCPDLGRYSIPAGQQAIPSQVGVFAREVADAALGLEVINGGRDPAREPHRRLGDFSSVTPAGLRVACYTDDGTFAPCPAARRAVREAARVLADAGAQVLEWQPPDIGEAVALMYGLFAADGARGFKRALGRDPRDPRVKEIEQAASAPAFLLPLIRKLLGAMGRGKTADITRNYGRHDTDWYWQLGEKLLDYQERWRCALDENGGGPIDLILSPASALPAVRHGATQELGVIGGYSCLWNVLGYPAGVLPVTTVGASEESDRPDSADKMDRTARETERGSAGLPIAVQIAARPWHEHVALSAMNLIESAACKRSAYPRYSKLWS